MTIKKQLSLDIEKEYKIAKKLGRYLLAKIISKFPTSSEYWGPPKDIYEETYDWFVRSQAKDCNFQAHYQALYPAEVRRQIEDPKGLQIDPPWQFRRLLGAPNYESPIDFLVTISDGRIYSSSASVITPDDYLLSDLSREFDYNQGKHSIFFRMKLPQVSYLKETVAVLATAGGNTYWHWMFDILSRYHLLEKSGIALDSIDKFIINKVHLPFQKETLQKVGIPDAKILFSRKYSHIKASRLIVPSIPRNVPKPWVIDFLRKRILNDNEVENGEVISGKYLYISRDDAKTRRVCNEIEVVQYLETLGFRSITLAGRSVTEQAKIFATADCIVAPHGSALTNIIFCQPGTKIIDIFPPEYINPCYWILSNQLGLNYYYLVGKGTLIPAPPQNYNPEVWAKLKHNNRVDITVDIQGLRQILELVGLGI
ncbi:capsular polysaccharide biosynthesis protein [Leptolyngbya sp. Heron Island J]|uniref:glycosyltransferase family 61 protein n=1 Tax=Leptolyngbya sp. Heron Island J TaxID=1385935 RepID=UPI0003B96893|nr:glycosyltransferase family 61 protein [Leptolyngbya sp. Heron Island J]ESA36034.1 capsular polysaccharide biosynthesis protein [Leptolyngbya sp. Heron Island J]